MARTADALTGWRAVQGTLRRGLPAAAYTDPGVFERENQTVFRSGWTFAGFAHAMPNVGDVQPIDIGGQPTVLVHQKSGDIQAFHNVCRHRCLKLVDKATNVGRVITCPYHAWAYGLDGALRSTPYFGGTDTHTPENFPTRDSGLVPIRTAKWQDWIFVNPDGEAEAFEDYAQPLISRLDGIDFDKLVPVTALDFGVVETNWKFLMENFIEPYHVQFVHTVTTNQPLKDHATFIDGRCVGSVVDLPEDMAATDSLAVSSRYLTLFPNFILGRYVPDQLGVYLNIPVDAGHTRQIRVIYKTDGAVPDVTEAEALRTLWWAVHKEDHHVCERMQAGRRSDVASDGGLLSPHWEDSVRAFQDMVADAIGAT